MKSRRVQCIDTIFNGKVAEVAECLPHGIAALRGHLRECLTGAANLLLALRRQGFKTLVAVKHALSLRRRLQIEPMQPIHQVLLLLRRQARKARFPAQRLLLLIHRQSAMLRKPLGQVLPTLRTNSRPEASSRDGCANVRLGASNGSRCFLGSLRGIPRRALRPGDARALI